MRAVVITVRHSLSVWGSSSKIFFTSEPRFGDYASSHVCDEKSSRRTPPSCAAWPHCQWEVVPDFAESQPMGGTFGLIFRRLHVGYRAARGRWSCSTVLQWRSRWSSRVRVAWSGRLVPQISLSLALLGRPRWWLLLWLQYGTSWQRWMACWCCAPSVLRMTRPRCRDSRSMYRLSRSRGRHHFSKR